MNFFHYKNAFINPYLTSSYITVSFTWKYSFFLNYNINFFSIARFTIYFICLVKTMHVFYKWILLIFELFNRKKIEIHITQLQSEVCISYLRVHSKNTNNKYSLKMKGEKNPNWLRILQFSGKIIDIIYWDFRYSNWDLKFIDLM